MQKQAGENKNTLGMMAVSSNTNGNNSRHRRSKKLMKLRSLVFIKIINSFNFPNYLQFNCRSTIPYLSVYQFLSGISETKSSYYVKILLKKINKNKTLFILKLKSNCKKAKVCNYIIFKKGIKLKWNSKPVL